MDTLVDLAIITFVVLAFGFYIFWRIRGTVQQNINLPNGEVYVSRYGTGLSRYGGAETFNGLEVELKKTLPHMLLDGHKSVRLIGPKNHVKRDQKLDLEGDFNSYFQLFVPKQYQQLALTILTPDTMQSLLESKGKYDIEIIGRYLRIIAYGRVSYKPEHIAEMKHIAETVLLDISHKMRSWNERSEQEAAGVILKMTPHESLKIGTVYISANLFVHLIAFVVPALTIWYLVLANPQEFTDELRWVSLFAGALFFPFGSILLEILGRRRRASK